MKTTLLVFLFCSGVFAQADKPSCYLNRISNQGTASLVVSFNAVDATPSGFVYNVTQAIDDPTFADSTKWITANTVGGTLTNTITNSWGSGAWNPEDGVQHHFFARINNSTTFGVMACGPTGQGWPFKWNVAGGYPEETYPLYNATNGGTIHTPANTGIIVNYSDPLGYGTTGATSCPDGFGHAMFADGTMSHYVATWGIPCSNVHYVTGTINQQHYSISQAATFLASLTTPLNCSVEKFYGLGWQFPSDINNINSTSTAGTIINGVDDMADYWARNACNGTNTIILSDPFYTGGFLRTGDAQGGGGSNQCYAYTSVTDPAVTCNYHPAAYIFSVTSCTSFTCNASVSATNAMVDAAFAARHTNPTGGQVKCPVNTGNFLSSACYSLLTQKIVGLNAGGFAPTALNVTVSTPSNPSATITDTNLLMYVFPGIVNSASTPSFLSGTGYFIQAASFPGDQNNGQQLPVGFFLSKGATFVCGSNFEPSGTLPRSYPEHMVLASGYLWGMTFLEAAAHSMYQPNKVMCAGDILGQAFTNSYQSAGLGGTQTFGKSIQYGKGVR